VPAPQDAQVEEATAAAAAEVPARQAVQRLAPLEAMYLDKSTGVVVVDMRSCTWQKNTGVEVEVVMGDMWSGVLGAFQT
jgi:hypothetical protein